MSKNNPFTSHLKKAQKAFDNANKAGGFVNKNVEDGKHQFRLIGANLVFVSNNTKLMVEWVCEFEVDKKVAKKNPEAGIIKSRELLESEQNWGYLKRKLDMFGYDVSELNLAQDLPQILKEIAKKKLTIEGVVRTSPDEQFQNVMFNRVLDEGEETEEDEDEEGDEEGDDEEEEDDEEEGDEDDDEDDEEGDDDESDEGDEPDFSKGDVVMFKPPRARKALKCKITKIGNGKADLKDPAGGVHKGILLEKLEAAEEEEDDEEEAGDEDEAGDEEEAFGEIEKGSKLEVRIKGKAYKATAVADPDEKNETVKVKITSGTLKGKVQTVDQADVELLD